MARRQPRQNAVTSPAQRLIVTLAAVHAARWAAIRDLTLDDLDLANRRITIAGHPQRLGELTCRALRAWLGHRSATWPHTPNRHVLISEKTALATGPVSRSYLNWNLQRHGVSIDRIRRDRVLHEALTARADPLHLALVFGLSHTTASRYTLIACDLLAGQAGQDADAGLGQTSVMSADGWRHDGRGVPGRYVHDRWTPSRGGSG